MRKMFISLLVVLCVPGLSLAGDYCVECHSSLELEGFGDLRHYLLGVHHEDYTPCPSLGAVTQGAFSAERAVVEARLLVEPLMGSPWHDPGPWLRALALASRDLWEVVSTSGTLHSGSPVVARLQDIRERAEEVSRRVDEARRRVETTRLRVLLAAGGLLVFSLLAWVLIRRMRRG
jgi:hypothetical protein